MVDLPAPQMMNETVEVVRSIPQKCVQSTVEQGVDVPVPQIQKRIVQVDKERPCELMGAERGNHLHQRMDRVEEQIDDGLVPRVTKEILDKIKTFPRGAFPS